MTMTILIQTHHSEIGELVLIAPEHLGLKKYVCFQWHA